MAKKGSRLPKTKVATNDLPSLAAAIQNGQLTVVQHCHGCGGNKVQQRTDNGLVVTCPVCDGTGIQPLPKAKGDDTSKFSDYLDAIGNMPTNPYPTNPWAPTYPGRPRRFPSEVID